MAAQSQPPLDEIQYRRPEIIDWWVNTLHAGEGLDENLMHRYLSESPFFDHTTKNGLLVGQAATNQRAFDLVSNRRMLEDQLSRQRGTEYMIVGDPQQVQGAAAGVNNGMWVIRKQDRDRRQTVDGRTEVDLTTLGTYYVVGENMYQAPSIGEIVGNRLLSAATSLSKFFDAAADLPTFSPTSEYSYLPQPTKATTSTSAQGSPSRSREGSVIPGADTQSLRSGSLAPDSQTSSSKHISNATQDARLLASSFKMALEFGDEYMDENPIVGEPGNFSFTSSFSAVKKRKADEEAAALAAKVKEQQQAASRAASPKVEKPPSPPAVMTEAKAVAKADKERRGSKIDRIKRKKSRPNAASPTTPVSATAASLPSAGS